MNRRLLSLLRQFYACGLTRSYTSFASDDGYHLTRVSILLNNDKSSYSHQSVKLIFMATTTDRIHVGDDERILQFIYTIFEYCSCILLGRSLMNTTCTIP